MRRERWQPPRQRRLATAAVLAFAVTVGCDEGRRAESTSALIRDSAGVRIVETSRPQSGTSAWEVDSVPSVRIGTAEGDEHEQLFRVYSALTTANGRIFISTAGAHEVRVFSRDGEFLYSFGRQGHGPGEFGEFSTMRMYRIAEDSLAITDGSNARLNVFTTDGEFVRTISLRPSNRFGRPGVFGRFSDGAWYAVAAVGSGALRGEPGERIDMERAYLAIPPDGEPEVLAVLPARPRVVNELGGVKHFPFVPLTPDASGAAAASSLLISDGRAAEVRRIAGSAKLVGIYRWSLPGRPVDAIWDRFRGRYLDEIVDENRRRRYVRFLERDLPIPDTLPAIRSLAVDAAGHTWVERFRLPWEETARFDVLSSDGQWLTTVELPARLGVLEIGRDHVLAREVDDLGIERVGLYRLQRGAPRAADGG